MSDLTCMVHVSAVFVCGGVCVSVCLRTGQNVLCKEGLKSTGCCFHSSFALDDGDLLPMNSTVGFSLMSYILRTSCEHHAARAACVCAKG